MKLRRSEELGADHFVHLWIITALLVAGMWLDLSLGTPVWPLRDVVYCTGGLVVANVAAFAL